MARSGVMSTSMHRRTAETANHVSGQWMSPWPVRPVPQTGLKGKGCVPRSPYWSYLSIVTIMYNLPCQIFSDKPYSNSSGTLSQSAENLIFNYIVVLKTCFVRHCQNISSILLLGFWVVLPQILPKPSKAQATQLPAFSASCEMENREQQNRFLQPIHDSDRQGDRNPRVFLKGIPLQPTQSWQR